ncbi:DUF3078 domain-containing protein [Hymenobacter baengnokdamensis]|uniref:DUF3078 domain-containing protein n=1 Tax=Hymenobacter baengnokdamensis TaxID=2615203 RepID=UPI00124766F4|nr:DUF3078 domain-containing protein [Hymenobacter baengnokdamensis]
MKKLFTLLLALGPAGAIAQALPTLTAPADTIRYWATSLKAGVNANEALLSDNWKGGGASSVGVSLLFNRKANYHRGRHSWDNEADFLYAGQYAKGLGYRKTTDRLWLDTKYGHDLTPHWGLFVALNALSQFAPGFDYSGDPTRLISSFLAPAYITNAYGAEYHPNARFKLRLSPFAPRLTVVRDADRFRTLPTDVVYGVNPGHNTRWEVLAAQILAELDQPLGPNANLKARYVLFANYETLSFDKISHRLDLTITAKVNRLLSVSFGTIVIYDYSQAAAVQYSQNLALGILLSREHPANAK